MSSSSSHPKVSLKKGQLVGHWKVRCTLGEGAFGAVYLVEKVGAQGSKRYAAMKIEPRAKDKEDEVLRMDVFVLSKVQACDKFCTIYDFAQNSSFSYVVMTLIGPSTLDDLRKVQPGRKFSKASTLKIGLQLLSALKLLHAAGFIHRDIKPANIAPGYKHKNLVYLFDFGLARFIYEDEAKTKLRRCRHRVSFRGTYRYCSINAHKNGDQGRVDDIWGALYTLIELCTGRLPWTGKPPSESCAIKENIADAELFRDCPPSFTEIKKKIVKLRYEDQPEYSHYQVLMHRDLQKINGRLDSLFEWEKKKKGDDGTWKQDAKQNEGQVAHREGGDTDTLRSVDDDLETTVTSSIISGTGTAGTRDIEDTLDDVPDDVLEGGEQKRQKKPTTAAVPKPTAGGCAHQQGAKLSAANAKKASKPVSEMPHNPKTPQAAKKQPSKHG